MNSWRYKFMKTQKFPLLWLAVNGQMIYNPIVGFKCKNTSKSTLKVQTLKERYDAHAYIRAAYASLSQPNMVDFFSSC